MRYKLIRGLGNTCLIVVAVFLGGCSKSDNGPGVESATSQSASSSETAVVKQTSGARPNILLVVLDDAGFTDLSAWGGVIDTPTMDTLARNGVMFTNFHSSPNCSPTRAMLLSGTDSHIAGLGNMAEELAENQKGKAGYEGYLNFRVAALSELLLEAGYHTYMTGKWHLGLTETTGPAARGFEKSFALLQGGAGAFDNMLPMIGPGKAKYREEGRLLDTLPEDFYSTAFYTDRMIDYIEADKGDGRPFFAYLAYTSPHWPLQAPEESIARYHGEFDEGYDVYKAERLAKLKELGLVDADVEAFPRLPGEPSWESLTDEQKRIEARKMEIYAAMMDDVDRYLGKLLNYLKAIGEYDNTFIFVMSDNGPEGHNLVEGWPALAEWVEECCDNSYENMGQPDSYIWYGPNWAQAGNTPLRMYKGFTSQGGVNVPAIAHFPKLISGGRRNNAIAHVMDIMPTILGITGVEHPGEGDYKGREIVTMQGTSLLPILTGDADEVHGEDYTIGWELFGKRALRQGDWKIIYQPYHEVLDPRPAGIKTDTWQLYNLADDPRELNDLSEEHPGKLKTMIGLWKSYAERNNVIIPEEWSGY